MTLSRLRPLLGGLALLLATAGTVHAQLSIPIGDGWTFTFAGNVNAFYVYEHESSDGRVTSPYALVGAGRRGSAIRTGLLPAFAVFDVRGKESGLDLGIHFGFAPQIQTAGGHDNEEETQAGARIDMRQVYLTLGGGWGQVLAGREVGLFGRQNLLTDQTLFGIGATGGNFGNPAGTTLGRIGFGYVYPNFNAQLTYSTPSARPLQLSVGLFDPSVNNGFDRLDAPRLETELTLTRGVTKLWVGGLLQQQEHGTTRADATVMGGSLGARVGAGPFTLVASGYLGRGIGTTTLFNGGASGTGTSLRPSWGFLTQAAYGPATSRWTVAASYGQSRLDNASDEPEFRVTNSSVTGGVYFQATRSLKVVGEATRARASERIPGVTPNTSIAGAAGLMLFF